ncbi:hypothetical protein T492DRAFT_833801 [Pavlovales sp. CCMP2436]|nr:hypothetical protein T492DRAFT_1148673 [Pavlovales sp. CCMP2436]KAJ1638370.1 hypothetical protein T492DRAFT_833801 [Pavlovales sp. CCMP2436]|mmetsp:Transcript_34994/g.80914  ORF Transcript_34994/g.80914 Transcript_34994/m.80914 type:complete len:324 (+) Transcript_34994:95-1066(+)
MTLRAHFVGVVTLVVTALTATLLFAAARPAVDLVGTSDLVSRPVVGTYLGALPGGRAPPLLSTLPYSINMVMLCFAKDNNGDGIFTAFSSWTSIGSIAADRANFLANTGTTRTYLISLGGAAAYGGIFRIKGVSVDKWISNAYDSTTAIISQFGAQGAEMQFEGGTGDSNFKAAMDGLLLKLKTNGFVGAIGPFYGGTSADYSHLNAANIDIVNMQMYATNCGDERCLATQTSQAIAQTPGGASKFVFGLCSAPGGASRRPSPMVGLTYLKNSLMAQGVAGMFSWDAEDDLTSNPPYCLEDVGGAILNKWAADADPSSCHLGA